MENEAYSWYDGAPESKIVSDPPPDQRKLPVNYPQGSGGRDLATGCRVKGGWRDNAGNVTCRWGCKSTGGSHCMYFRHQCMCDKVTDKDGKEVN